MILIAAVDIWIPVVVAGLVSWGGLLARAHFRESAADEEANAQAEHWRQALLPVIDVTKEIRRQFRNDDVVKSVVRESLSCASDTLEGILREHAGPRVAPRISALRDVYKHVGELHEIYKPGSRAFTDETQPRILESAASLEKEAEALRDALK